MAIIDQTITYRKIGERLAATTNPRHKLMLERLYQHARGEVEEDLEAVLGTLAPHPVYKVQSQGPEMNPEGMENVRKFYIEQIFAKGRHVLESLKTRIVVADDQAWYGSSPAAGTSAKLPAGGGEAVRHSRVAAPQGLAGAAGPSNSEPKRLDAIRTRPE